ncbi:MAG: hypothetical protein DHS20C14_08770 [Phycisphaeraceae bacterium]|nr:MAG: hypothetical protein DHS20C14_08770 [Phycisphaeraceae bacterium]
MEIDEQRHGAVTILRPRGPIAGQDGAGLAHRAKEVLAQSRGRFVLDASDVAFTDSDGLEALLEITEMFSSSGQALKICAATETLREILTLTGLSDEFEHYEDAQHAVRSFL